MSDAAAWDTRYSADDEHIFSIIAMLPDLRARSATLSAIRSLGLFHAEVLEIGCGTGQHSLALAQEFPSWHFQAIDTSPRAVQAAMALSHSSGIPVDVSLGDAGALPFADDSMDIVFGDHVIGHIPDRKRAEREIVRVLKSGGYAIFNSGNRLRPDGWPLYHALSDKRYLAQSFYPWTLAMEFSDLGCRRVGSFGSVLVLKRGFSLLLHRNYARHRHTDTKTGNISIRSGKVGLITRIYRFLDANTPAWLKTDYGVVLRKL